VRLKGRLKKVIPVKKVVLLFDLDHSLKALTAHASERRHNRTMCFLIGSPVRIKERQTIWVTRSAD
jgi:hypothetical protein